MDKHLIEKLDDHDKDIAVLKSKSELVQSTQEAILLALKEIQTDMVRYKGFMGGVAFLASGIGIAATVGKDWLVDHLK